MVAKIWKYFSKITVNGEVKSKKEMREIVTISKRFIDIKYDKPFGFKRSYRAFIFLSLGAKTAEHLTLIKANLKKVQLGLAVEPGDEEMIENESIEQLEIEYG